MGFRRLEPYRRPAEGPTSGQAADFSRWLSSLSHEMRTPLTSIGGYAELLMDGDGGELTADQRGYAEIIERNANRLARLFDDLLALSHLEERGSGLDRSPFDMAVLVSGLVEEHRAEAKRAGVELVVSAPPGPEVFGDAARLRRAIGHLIANAVKFSPTHGRVLVETRHDEVALSVSVRDFGVGIPEADLASLGQRFSRASTAGAERGSGLGLAIARTTVEGHGGRIEVESEEGVGSTFRIHLPTHAREDRPPGAKADAQAEHMSEPAAGSESRVA